MADNQSAIALSRNPEFHKRTKHFNIKFHYQRAVLNTGEISLQYVRLRNRPLTVSPSHWDQRLLPRSVVS
ncbi:uncharacterized protein N7525_007415 [Penicillium rubens]|uniref:uncharacterized protein n=1 Tax=Penicillium rubens TaxID=1108849 RepID=UPI00238DA646|nr:uncharacterized protein N7525_007415 [Penicillium rubens]KAJ5265213.1 hypothetical protein N7524_006231 [Penicillium chrysogenum]KAJ5829162.1 hypothetical protein N7525_007415 [Penicillium rubens]